MLQISLLAILLCAIPIAKGWKNIVPLHSSRADVERLLGPPSASCKSLCRYETKAEVVFVRYSGEPCTNKDENRWQVPSDTVIDVAVNLGKRAKLSDLKLNLKTFIKSKDPELHGYTTYTNAEMGVAYSVVHNGQVYSINWFPSANDENALQCPSLK